MSPVASQDEAIKLISSGSPVSEQGKKLAKEMTLDDVKELWRQFKSGESYPTPGEWQAMMYVIDREIGHGKITSELFTDTYEGARGELWSLLSAYADAHLKKSPEQES